MESTLPAFIVAKYNYWVSIVLMMIGLYALIAKNNFVKKIIGLGIFQTSIILFYISISVKRGATIPILEHHAPEAGAHGHEVAHAAIDVAHYANPLPHVLMLTAIVVGVATFGVALALCERIYREYGSLEESEVLKRIETR